MRRDKNTGRQRHLQEKADLGEVSAKKKDQNQSDKTYLKIRMRRDPSLKYLGHSSIRPNHPSKSKMTRSKDRILAQGWAPMMGLDVVTLVLKNLREREKVTHATTKGKKSFF